MCMPSWWRWEFSLGEGTYDVTYVCICTQKHIYAMFVCMCVNVRSMYVSMSACMHPPVYVCMHVWTHISTYVRINQTWQYPQRHELSRYVGWGWARIKQHLGHEFWDFHTSYLEAGQSRFNRRPSFAKAKLRETAAKLAKLLRKV